MIKKLIIPFAIILILFGCGNTNEATEPSITTLDTTESESFDISAIQDEIESNILTCELSPNEVEVALLTSSDENLYCSIHSSWSENTFTFLAECYYIIPVVKELMLNYECSYSSIDISSQDPNNSDKIRRLTYLSDNDITLLDSSEDNILNTTYNYEQLNNQKTVALEEYGIYSDEYVSFEYNKNLFTVNPSDDKLTLAIKCPTIPEAPIGAHNTVLGIVTQTNQYISEISKNDVYETLETIAKTICQGLFELNEGETIITEDTKYSDYSVEYSMEISDGSLCYAKTLNYNTYITTVVLRICSYSEDYNNAFLDIYNSSHSQLGNYDFSDTPLTQIESTPEPQIIEEPTPQDAEQSTNANISSEPEIENVKPVGDTVWLSATGEKYHRINHCGQMNPDNAHEISLEDAIGLGYKKCDKCF